MRLRERQLLRQPSAELFRGSSASGLAAPAPPDLAARPFPVFQSSRSLPQRYHRRHALFIRLLPQDPLAQFLALLTVPFVGFRELLKEPAKPLILLRLDAKGPQVVADHL